MTDRREEAWPSVSRCSKRCSALRKGGKSTPARRSAAEMAASRRRRSPTSAGGTRKKGGLAAAHSPRPAHSHTRTLWAEGIEPSHCHGGDGKAGMEPPHTTRPILTLIGYSNASRLLRESRPTRAFPFRPVSQPYRRLVSSPPSLHITSSRGLAAETQTLETTYFNFF